jgi:hypothetical protein
MGALSGQPAQEAPRVDDRPARAIVTGSMRVEELLSRASARGVDLSRLAPPRRRHRRAEERRRLERGYWSPPPDEQNGNGAARLPLLADGKASRTYTRPAWSLAELGMAAHDVPRLPYLAKLAALVLDEEQHAPLFRAAPTLPAIYCGVSDRCWERVLSRRYGAVQLRWLAWLAEAHTIIQPRFADDTLAE